MSNTRKSEQRAVGGGQWRRRRLAFYCLLLAAYCLLASGCRMDMQDQPKYKYFRAGDKKFFPDGSSSRLPVEGTVARQKGKPEEYRDREDYFYTGKAAGAQAQAVRATLPSGATPGATGAAATTATGEPDQFPFPIDRAVLERGRQRFEIYCIVCHGKTGEGDGMIVRRGFQKPPSYYDDRLQEGHTPASHFFDVITNGWGAMPDYSAQVSPEDRWKIIAYLRALQLSRRLKLEELSPDDQNKVKTAAQQPPAGEHGDGTTPLQSPHGGEQH